MSQEVVLFGFEEGLADLISKHFQFFNPSYDDVVLVGGRNLYVQDLPEIQEIAARETVKPFDPAREPVVSIGVNVGPGVKPTISSGKKQEWNIQIVLRFGKAPEVVKSLLEDLADFLLQRRGRVSTGFLIKGTVMMSRPTIIDVQQNGLAMASTVIKYFAVPLPR